MTELEEELIHLLEKRSLQKGSFALSSGGRSDHYLDLRMVSLFSRGAYIIGELLYEKTKNMELACAGGPEAGAIPLVTALAVAYHRHDRELEGFWVRKNAKEHGTMKMIEGKLWPRARAVILEDVVTSGASVLRAAQMVEEEGGNVVGIIALVDRLAGAGQHLRDWGFPHYWPCFRYEPDRGFLIDS